MSYLCKCGGRTLLTLGHTALLLVYVQQFILNVDGTIDVPLERYLDEKRSYFKLLFQFNITMQYLVWCGGRGLRVSIQTARSLTWWT